MIVSLAGDSPRIIVDLEKQWLRLQRDGVTLLEYPVSTGINGVGELNGSGCTPRGWHVIRARIGVGCPVGTVFVGRRPTGEIYSDTLSAQFPDRDWILSRILWLGGTEPGRNRYGKVDTLRRFIYIHGTPDSEPMGQPASHGCIRMRNASLVELFERVRVGTGVLIEAKSELTIPGATQS